MIRDFRDLLNSLLYKTVTQTPLILVMSPDETRGQLTFRRQDSSAPLEAPLHAGRFGPLYLYAGQVCEAFEEDGRYRLRTISYRYTLRPDGEQEPALRWEYAKQFRHRNTCRHHLQGPHSLPLGRSQLSLQDAHLPTGYLTIEEVIRFCIVDLDVRPLSDDWHDLLEESYRRFKRDFAPRGPGAT